MSRVFASSRVPHPIPYQGSKRRLAAEILAFAPESIDCMFEPFAGSAAVTLAAAHAQRARRYILSDKLEPLAELWRWILSRPETIATEYERQWIAQERDPRGHYLRARDAFNRTGDPGLLLYLLARCVKNAVRFNARGQFNQSADHRRRGVHPRKMRDQILGAAAVLGSCCEVLAADYADVINCAGPRDFVYLDPPYQGVSDTGDPRYFEQLDYERFVDRLTDMRGRQVPFAVSFDGYCGQREYGQPLPDSLGLDRVLLSPARSAQATLSGRAASTRESLYIQPTL